MRGQKKKQELAKRHPIAVDGFDLTWELHSEPRFTSQYGFQGLCLLVRKAEGSHRHLILEYPFPEKDKKPFGMAHKPERTRIFPPTIADDIRLAMEAGWSPTARGKPFHFLLTDET